jgi:hypothetical protein
VRLVTVCFWRKTINLDCNALISWFHFVATTSFTRIKLQSTLSSLNSSSYMFHKYYYEFYPKIYFTNSDDRNSLLTYEKGKGQVRPRKFLVSPKKKVYSSTLSLTSALRGSGCSTPRPDSFTPAETRYPLHRWLRRWQVLSGLLRNTTGIRSPDRPTCSEPLYSLRHFGPFLRITTDGGYSHTAKKFFSWVTKRNVGKSIAEIWRCIKHRKIK